MNELPIIRLELEHMKQTMMTALVNYNAEITDYVDAALQDAIESFPFRETVKNIAHESIQKMLSNYFAYGQGYEMLNKALEHPLAETFSELDKGQ